MVLNVTIDGKVVTYMAHFVHKPPSLRVLPWSRRTVCTLHKAPCTVHSRPCHTHNAHYGTALCSRKDNFCKFTGRKLAFTRAVSAFPREVRTQLWREFWRNIAAEVAPVVKTEAPEVAENKEAVVA